MNGCVDSSSVDDTESILLALLDEDEAVGVDGFDSEKLKDGINWMIEEKNNLKNNKIREKIDQFNSSRIAKKYIEIYKRFFTN